MRPDRGFSVVELFIAIAIILVLTAIAVPSFLRSHVAANEALAIGSLKQIDSAQAAYLATYPANGYARSLAQLGPPSPNSKVGPNAAGLLDSSLGCAVQPCLRNGYGFVVDANRANAPVGYRSIAMPIHPGLSGGRGFCESEKHLILYDPDGNAHCTKRLD